MNNDKLNRVLELILAEKPKDALLIFDEIVPEDTIGYYMVKGKLEQKFQNWGMAMNSYSKVIDLDPENAEAQNRIHVIKNILNFWNPEMFNP